MALAKLLPLFILLHVTTAASLGWLWKFQQGFGENPEVHMDVTEIITSKGYPCENHWVTTEDGYILNLQRIPHGRNDTGSNKPRPVVLIQHGLMGSSIDFVINLANESLGYLLADRGVDVWLGNSRGNTYSTNHTTLDPKQNAFWDFRWDEMAKYDLPSTINYITNRTGSEQIIYIGYSQGTTIGFARFSEDPVLARKVKHFIAMAPIGHVGHITSILRLLVPIIDQFELFLDTFGHGAFKIPPAVLEFVAAHLCQQWGKTICMNMNFLMMGFDPQSFNVSRADVYNAHAPAGTSAKNFLQWAQGVKSNKFQHFDWGSPEKNMQKYGQPTPPLYDPSKVNLPVTIVRGGHDILANPTDVQWLLPQLNVTLDINVDRYDHLDFALGMDAPHLVYRHLYPIITGRF